MSIKKINININENTIKTIYNIFIEVEICEQPNF